MLDEAKKKKEELDKVYLDQSEVLQKLQYQIKMIDNDIASKRKEIQLQDMQNKKQQVRNNDIDSETIDMSQKMEEIFKNLEELRNELGGLEQ